jgi:hypothetical protein
MAIHLPRRDANFKGPIESCVACWGGREGIVIRTGIYPRLLVANFMSNEENPSILGSNFFF